MVAPPGVGVNELGVVGPGAPLVVVVMVMACSRPPLPTVERFGALVNRFGEASWIVEGLLLLLLIDTSGFGLISVMVGCEETGEMVIASGGGGGSTCGCGFVTALVLTKVA